MTIHCQFDGRPFPNPAQVEWYRDGVRIDSDSISGNITSLRVTDVQQSSVYQCRVSNEHGSDLASVSLCVEQEGKWGEEEGGRAWGSGLAFVSL